MNSRKNFFHLTETELIVQSQKEFLLPATNETLIKKSWWEKKAFCVFESNKLICGAVWFPLEIQKTRPFISAYNNVLFQHVRDYHW